MNIFLENQVLLVSCVYSSGSYSDIAIDVYCRFLSGSQLLNQLEGSGPPPADEQQIKSLPKVKVTQTEIGRL